MTTKSRILIVDDDAVSLLCLKTHLLHQGYDVITAENGQDALASLANEHVDVIISDLVMPEMDGIQLMHEVKARMPAIPFVVLTARGSVGTAVTAIRQGALDYLEKPFEPQALELTMRRALEFGRLTGENERLREHFRERFSFHNIVTQSPAMGQVLELASRVAGSPRTTVSLTGESGTGKEVLARAIHYSSGCMPGTFVAVNCAAIPEALLESELFGHVRGAFTGADRDREGKFAHARGGTLLLDEIGDMPLGLQAKLLRVLEERVYEKVGSSKPLPADFRVIAATHRDLAQLVRQGLFREDLYHRINVVPIAIPPLRERREDIPLLVEFFLDLFRKHQGKPLPGASKAAMDALTTYSWPGNIRELRNVLEYAAIVVSDELIRPEHLRLTGGKTSGGCGHGAGCHEYRLEFPSEELSLDALVQKVLEITLDRCGGNKSKAADLLKVNRKMFYR